MNHAAERGARDLAQRWATMDPAHVDRIVRERLGRIPHKSRVLVELDFNARLITHLRIEGVWPRGRCGGRR